MNIPSQCRFTQSFGGKLSGPSSGHTGVDYVCGYGSAVLCPYDGEVYKVLSPSRPSFDGTGFTGVFVLVDNGIESFEYLTGHLDPTVTEKTVVQRLEKLGTESNHGEVYFGTQRITLAMQKAGDTRAHHRHDQKRPFKKVKSTSLTKKYLTAYADSGYGTPYYDGHYYEILFPNNGFNGCIDPLGPIFKRRLMVGMSGYDVYVLQRILVREGLLTAEPTAFFGTLTLASLIAFQKKYGLFPFPGYAGPKTLEKLNSYTK